MISGKNLIILTFLFLVIFTLGLNAQTAGVTGRVEDAAQNGIAGATVILRDKRTGVERTVNSDSEGRFTFPDPGNGEFEIVVSAAGFGRLIQDVSFGGGEIRFMLVPQPIKEYVTVTATRTQISTDDTAVPVSVVGREDIERKAVNTIGDIFRTLPGTSTNNEGAFQSGPVSAGSTAIAY